MNKLILLVKVLVPSAIGNIGKLGSLDKGSLLSAFSRTRKIMNYALVWKTRGSSTGARRDIGTQTVLRTLINPDCTTNSLEKIKELKENR